jgi:beta-lactamase regulating signal transducer with metallopeptidase domain
VFWWNPFVHLLRRELDHILEIQCDLSITSQMDEQRRIRYLESILKVIREARNITVLHTTPMNCAALVSTNKTQKIEQRFNLVLDYNSSSKKQHKFHILLMCAMILLTFLALYKLVIQPVYTVPAQSQEEIFDINPENSYLILNENGTYSLYADGKYRCDITNIDTEPFSLLPVK